MQQMRLKNGSPLPMGSKLRWILQLQILPEHAFIHCSCQLAYNDMYCQVHVESTERIRRELYNGILLDDFLHFSIHLWSRNNWIPMLPSLVNNQIIH